MDLTDDIAKCLELSQELKKILKKAKFFTFWELSRRTITTLRKKAPKLKVRHLANLESALRNRDLDFYPDDSIRLDEFINQRKLFNLWQKGVYTYRQLNSLQYNEFEATFGGPKSRFFTDKAEARA